MIDRELILRDTMSNASFYILNKKLFYKDPILTAISIARDSITLHLRNTINHE